MEVYVGKTKLFGSDDDPIPMNYEELVKFINMSMRLDAKDFYMLYNGKRIKKDDEIPMGAIYVVIGTRGGKGGFGALLKDMGAKISKSTNTEACRDLNGRRLRTVNEEQRLSKQLAQQPAKDQAAKERKSKKFEKLQKLLEQPKFEFDDEEYLKQRSAMPEVVEKAVLQGLELASRKRKLEEDKQNDILNKTKKTKLWWDLDPDLLDSENDEDSDTNTKESS